VLYRMTACHCLWTWVASSRLFFSNSSLF